MFTYFKYFTYISHYSQNIGRRWKDNQPIISAIFKHGAKFNLKIKCSTAYNLNLVK